MSNNPDSSPIRGGMGFQPMESLGLFHGQDGHATSPKPFIGQNLALSREIEIMMVRKFLPILFTAFVDRDVHSFFRRALRSLLVLFVATKNAKSHKERWASDPWFRLVRASLLCLKLS